MGIRIPEAPGPFGDDQGACFAVGETPLFLQATFSGIKTGDLWNPAIHPLPPNRAFSYQQSTLPFFHWGLDGTVWIGAIIFEQFLIPGSQVGIGNTLNPPFDFMAFQGGNVNDCIFFFENGLIGAAGHEFYGGKCQITWSA